MSRSEPSDTDVFKAARPPLPDVRKTGTFGMLLFLASLTMLFGATMIGYVVIRLQLLNPDRDPNPPLGEIAMPLLLWLSTFVILASSATLHYAGMSIAVERQRPFRRAMTITTVLGYAFLLIQIPALTMLAKSQASLSEVDSRLYALIIFMVIVHGLHVVGGLIPLTVITRKARRGAYDHEQFTPVTHMAMYWHFLDAVWLVMFGTMMFLR